MAAKKSLSGMKVQVDSLVETSKFTFFPVQPCGEKPKGDRCGGAGAVRGGHDILQ